MNVLVRQRTLVPFVTLCFVFFPLCPTPRATLTAQAKELSDRLASKSEKLEQVMVTLDVCATTGILKQARRASSGRC